MPDLHTGETRCVQCGRTIYYDLNRARWLRLSGHGEWCFGMHHQPERPLDAPPDLSDVEAIENWLESGA